METVSRFKGNMSETRSPNHTPHINFGVNVMEAGSSMQSRTCPIIEVYTSFLSCHFRSGSRAATTSKMERFVIIVNGFQPLTIITKRSILDVAAALDPPLHLFRRVLKKIEVGMVTLILISLTWRLQPWQLVAEYD